MRLHSLAVRLRTTAQPVNTHILTRSRTQWQETIVKYTREACLSLAHASPASYVIRSISPFLVSLEAWLRSDVSVRFYEQNRI